MNPDLRHSDSERELLITLAARPVLQATDIHFAQLDGVLASIRHVLKADYPQLVHAS